MVYSRLPLIWAATLCCVTTGSSSSPPVNGTSQSITSLSIVSSQDSSSRTTPPFSSSTVSSFTISSPTSTSIATLPYPSSTLSQPVQDTVPPPAVAKGGSITQTGSKDGGSASSSTVEVIPTANRVGVILSSNSATSTVHSDENTEAPTISPIADGYSNIASSTVVAQSTITASKSGPSLNKSIHINTDHPSNQVSTFISRTLSENASTSLSFSVNSTSLHQTRYNTTMTKSHSSVRVVTVPTTAHSRSIYSRTTITPTTISTSSCIPYTPGETITVWSLVPNTTTVTLTLYPNETNTYTTMSQWTPPVTCPPREITSARSRASTSSQNVIGGVTTVVAGSSFTTYIHPPHSAPPTQTQSPIEPTFTQATTSNAFPVTSTIIVTSKNPATVFTTQTNPLFPGGGPTQKQPAQLTTNSPPSDSWPSISLPLPPIGGALSPTTSVNNIGSGSPPPLSAVGGSPTTVQVGSVTVVVGPSSIAIGTATVVRGPGSSSGGSGSSGDSGGSGSGLDTIITQGGEIFTVNPSQIIGPGTIIPIPTDTPNNGGVFEEGPTTTMVDGISVAVGNGVAVIDGSTFAIGGGAAEETITIGNQHISVGPGGVGFADTTITPPAILPTNVIVFDGEPFTVIGASVAVIDGSSFTFTGGTPRTTVFNKETITAEASGFVFDGTSTLGGPSHPTGTQYGLAGGIAISEIGSSIAVINGTTLTVGPSVSKTTATIEDYTITAGPSGVTIGGSNGGTTLTFPFNPTTQEVAVGDITFSAIGSSLVNIGGTTFTIGPGATPTTDVYNGQTISIGPGGIGFATTTITSFTTSSPSATGNKKKNGGMAMRPCISVLGACMALGVLMF